MTNTPNHEYNTPSEGTENWHIPLNKNFEKLDVDVEVRGKEENKGDFEPEIGTKYEATDSGAVYFGNGDTWVLADRRVGQLQADTVLTKQIQNTGPRIVSPSIDAGYDLLQAAIDDAAEGGSSLIWLTEDIEENVKIPTDDAAQWSYLNGGLTIRGEHGTHTKIKDAVEDGETPVITNDDTPSQLHNLTLEGIHVTGTGDSGPAIRIDGCPFFTMVNCVTDMPSELQQPFFSYFERCTFNSNTFIETDISGITGNSVTTDTPLILDGGNLVRIDACTFRASTGETNWACLWLCQINNLELNQPEFKILKGDYDESAPRSVSPLLIDGACGDINMNSPYWEQSLDTQLRTAQTPLTNTGSPRAIYIRNGRLYNITIDQFTAGLFVELDGAVDTLTLETNAFISDNSYIKGNFSDTNTAGSRDITPKLLGRDSATTPALPDETGKSVQNPNPYDCFVHHNGSGAVVNIDDTPETLYGSPVIVPMRKWIQFTDEVPSDWTWRKFESY